MTQEPGRRRRRLIGMGFVIAFVLSTATLIYTGLHVRAAGSARTEEQSASAAAADDGEDSGAETPSPDLDSQ